jgi:hypothetical protein
VTELHRRLWKLDIDPDRKTGENITDLSLHDMAFDDAVRHIRLMEAATVASSRNNP